jgi:anthranilate phosphoribosyltransferase
LNSALALYTAGKGDSIKACIPIARSLIDNGTALRKLDQFVQLSNEAAS